MEEYLDKILELKKASRPFSLVTIVDARGSLPQNIGAKAIITAAGIVYGTVGGGKLETWAIKKSQELFSKNTNTFFEKLNLQTDIGMNCGGEASLFYELYNCNDWSIAIFGAGHIAQALVRTLLPLECKIYCADIRQEWLDKLPHSNNLIKMKVKNYEDAVEKIPANSYLLTMTMGHRFDVPVLAKALRAPSFKFVGGIGSTTKANNVKADLKKLDLTKEQIERFVSPVGLKFGKNDPSEISISIVAQLLSLRDLNNRK